MYDLSAFTLKDMTICGAALRQLGEGAASMEEVANRTVHYLFEQQTYNIFHVPDALDNHYIPDQADFVLPYDIRSVLGFFGLLPSGNLFTVIVFAKALITRDMTDYFRPLTLNVKMAILPFDDTVVFASDTCDSPPAPAQEVAQFRSQAASLSHLLSVHERVVQEQSDRIAQMVTAAAVTVERNRSLAKPRCAPTSVTFSASCTWPAIRKPLSSLTRGVCFVG